MSGVTPEGFVGKRLPEIKEELEERLTDSFGDIDLRAESVWGQQVGIHSELDALLWALAEDVYQSQYPDSASGVALDHAVSINGIVRTAATPTQVTAVAYGEPGTTLSAGREAANRRTGDVYRSTLTTTIRTGAAVYARFELDTLDDTAEYRVTIGGTDYTYQAESGDGSDDILDGLFDALSGAPLTRTLENGALIAEWDSPGAVSASDNIEIVELGSELDMVAIEPGDLLLPAGDLTEIETPVSGWDRIDNPSPGITGSARESDEALRLRREESILITATNTLDAIISRLRQVPLVQDVEVRENNGTEDDEFGTPRQHVWAIVEGGDDEDIAEVLFNTVAGGIGMRGEESVIVTSEVSGKDFEVQFDRPTYIDPTILVEYIPFTGFPADGEQRIIDALVEYGDRLLIAQKLVVPRLYTPINSVPGVDVELLEVDGSGQNIIAEPNEKIRILAENITLVDVS